MERLTKRIDDEAVFKECACKCEDCFGGAWPCVRPILTRLAAYEETGLDPERIAELAQEETDGRLVVLPCRVTDTVYIIESVFNGKKYAGERVVSAQIDRVTVGGTTGKPVFDLCSETEQWHIALEPGEFYLTREEAEAALKEQEATHGV